jgi:hypothetical protein
MFKRKWQLENAMVAVHSTPDIGDLIWRRKMVGCVITAV